MYNSVYNKDDGSLQDFPKIELSCEVNRYNYSINLKMVQELDWVLEV